MYKGKYIATITEEDVANPSMGLRNLMGRVLKADIGKQVWENDGQFSVENDEQRDKRLAEHKPDKGRMLSLMERITVLTISHNEEMEKLIAEFERAKEGR